MEIIFWLIISIIIYAYFGYPIIIYFLSKLSLYGEKEKVSNIEHWPIVDLLIAAYNEEKVIDSKIDNSLQLDYPSDCLNIWIASDGSSDRTNEIVKKYVASHNNVYLLEFPRTGKSGIINQTMKIVKNDIVVFSDANTEYSKDALKKLISHFNNPRVGCVSGRLIYRNPGETISGIGESFYWKYETQLKKIESRIGYVAGANGAIYAIRKELFEPFHARTINDDFTASMKIVQKGYRSIYEEKAVVYEDVAPTMKAEFKRHVRDGAGHYMAITHLLGLLNPFLGIRSFIYWSHRILRWMIPFLLITILVLNLFLLASPVYLVIFALQILFYLLAIIGYTTVNSSKQPFFVYVPFYFCNLNLALLMGFIKTITNKQKTTWERTERNQNNNVSSRTKK